MTTKSVTLDVWLPSDVRVKVNQGEVNSRFLEIKILDKNKTFDLTGKTAIFYATKPDGNLIFNYCEIVDAQKGIVNLALTSQMSIASGIMRDCEIDILDEELTKLKVKGLSIEIARCTDFESAIESTSEFTVLDEALADVKKVMDAYSDENIMEKIMSMDGEGSGLDADLLDGKHGSEYATSAQGAKADSALQGISGNGATISPNEEKIVNITPENIGAASSAQGEKADSAIQGISGSGATISPNEEKIVNITPENIGAAAENHSHSAADITTGTLPISLGGTGANEIYTAQRNLGLMKRYSNFNHLALKSNYTLKDVFLAMEDNSYIEYSITSSMNITIGPVGSGELRIYRISKIFGYAEFWGNSTVGNSKWVGSLHASKDFSWNKIYTSNQTVPIRNGGTGATTASAALSNLGAATTEQGTKADSAIQGVKVNGTLVNPDSAQIVDIDVTSIGGATTEQGAKADSALQGITGNGTTISPNEEKIVDITPENIGAAAENHSHSAADITSGILPISQGGTGATTASAALSNLGAATTEQGEKADSAIQGVKLNGTLVEPNDQKIVDIIVNESGSSSVTYTAEIGTTWETAETGEYTQTVAVTGILETDNPIVDVILDSSKDVALSQLEAWSYISKIETSADQITVTCLENKPTVAISIQLKVVR